MIATARRDGSATLASDEPLWALALDRVKMALETAIHGTGEAWPSVLAVVVAAARADDPAAPALIGLLKRVLVRTNVGSESGLRCLRALARMGEAVDLVRLSDALRLSGRPARLAHVAVAEIAAHEGGPALQLLIDGLETGLRTESAFLLSRIGSDAALDALAPFLRNAGPAGVHAAGALLAFQDDPFAMQALCERLCEPADALLAAQALWDAAPGGVRLELAASTLARWMRRGTKGATPGHVVAAVALTAGQLGADLAATHQALGSDDDELVLLGAQAAYCVGDSERARGALPALFRRGPTVARQAFQLLVRWADVGDDQAMLMLRGVLDRRPIDLGRAPVYEALATTTRPALLHYVTRALHGGDRATALEAARGLAKLREPPSVIPPLWL